MSLRMVFLLILIGLLLVPFALAQNRWLLNYGPFGGLCGDVTASPNGIFYASFSNGIYRSGTHGFGWQQFTTETHTWKLLADNNYLYVHADTLNVDLWLRTGTTNTRIFQNASVPTIDQQGWLYVANGITGVGYYRSTNHGQNWTLLPVGNIPYTNRPSPIGVLPDGNLIVAHGSDMLRSTNHGNTWDTIGTNPFGNWSRQIKKYAFTSRNVIFAATYYDSLYRSNDTARTWSYVSRFPTIYDMDVSGDSTLFIIAASTYRDSTFLYHVPVAGGTIRLDRISQRYKSLYTHDPNGIFMGGDYPGVLKSLEGRTWSASVDSLTDMAIRFVRFSTNRIHAFTDLTHLYSDDDGINWVQSNFRKPTYRAAISIQGILYAVSTPDSSLPENRVYRSTDNGATWDTTAGHPDGRVYKLSVATNGTVYVVVYSNAMHSYDINFSTDRGAHWDHPSFTPTISATDDLVATDSVVYLCTIQGIYQCYPRDFPRLVSVMEAQFAGRGVNWGYYFWSNGLLYSTNARLSGWSIIAPPGTISSGLVAVNSIGHVNILSGTTVVSTTNLGTTWTTPVIGLPVSTINTTLDFQINPASNILYAGMSHGLYYTRYPTTDVFETPQELLPKSVTLLRSYPNPFNSTTTISFSLPLAATASLIAYNVNGESVATLLDAKKMTAGNHSIRFDGRNIASGIYFLRFNAGIYSGQQKVLLMK